MAAPPLSHTFESGQPDTTTISGANSAVGGNAFDAIVGTPTYSTTHAHAGTLSMKITEAGSHVSHQAEWRTLGQITADVWVRFYLWAAAVPNTASERYVRANNDAGTGSCLVGVQSTTGVVLGFNGAQTGTAVGSVAISTSQWIRIEARLRAGAGTGQVEWRLYNTPEAAIASYDDTNSASSMANSTNIDRVAFGTQSAGTLNQDFWIDDIAVSTTDWIGPSVTTAHDANIEWLHF